MIFERQTKHCGTIPLRERERQWCPCKVVPVSDNLGACMGEPGLLVRFHGAEQQSEQSKMVKGSDKKPGLLEGIPTSWSQISVFVYSSPPDYFHSKERNVNRAELSCQRIWVLSAFVLT